MRATDGALLAIGDLHAEHGENRELVARIEPQSERDWLIVCGDVADRPDNVAWALRLLRSRFAKLIWVPGNHELLAHADEPASMRGEPRYRHLVELCRELDVVTPEDPYPIWDGPGGPVRVVPLFLLYDYSFGRNGATREQALQRAYDAGVVCVDEILLAPDPHASRAAWCESRVREAEDRLTRVEPILPSVLVNHYPLLEEPTRLLRHPEFAQWCGTTLTADWHRRFRATAVVYGHLHIPRTSWHDGVRFEEVSLGYPRERKRWPAFPRGPRRILPEARRA
jgi:3',5'-cyclic AMP phosphodiesterase CpdA